MLEQESTFRLAAFLSIFAIMALFELFAPRLSRDEMMGALKTKRWFTNLSMVVLSSVMVRLVFPAAAVGVALFAQGEGWGLFNLLDVPFFIAAILTLIILDFAVWLEHVVSHKWPILWRIHRMHHADTGFDVTTALRFHPLEIVLSMVWKALVIIVLGAPTLAVLLFEIVLNGMAMFNHANVKLPLKLDHILRKIIVTPDMHRVHHSVVPQETDSNYGFNLSIWDRLFGTYIAAPKSGYDAMIIGLNDYRGSLPSKLLWALALPFKAVPKQKK